MTAEKLKSVFSFYKDYLQRTNTNGPRLAPKQLDDGSMNTYQYNLADSDYEAHLLFMCEAGPRFADAGEIDKAMRWFGFLQGTLWANQVFTLDELRNHSK
jgi:hypothetical protein